MGPVSRLDACLSSENNSTDALGEMYGGSDRVVDSCLEEVVDALRRPGTLPHVLCIVRCWFADMAKLRTALQCMKQIPTLLVWGDRDCTISLSCAANLKRKLRGSKLIVLAGGHSVFQETPEECNRIMLDWLGRQLLSISRQRNLPRVASGIRRTRGTPAMRPLSPRN
jgi:pimeloyl-ACP methyl ester carboxylesterase